MDIKRNKKDVREASKFGLFFQGGQTGNFEVLKIIYHDRLFIW